MQYQLFYPLGYDLSLIQDALQAEQIQVRPVTDSGELDPQEGATAFLLTPESRDDFSSTVLQRFVEAGGTVVALGTPDESDVPEELPLELLAAFLRSPYGAREILLALRTAYREAAARTALERAKRDAALRTRELGELMRIGMALNTERDYEQLQSLILTQARELSSSDAASLYLVETLDDDKRQLRLKFSQTYSRPEIPLVERTMPIDKSSIVGYVAATGKPLVIGDAYFLPPDSEYTIDRFFDRKWGYRTKSMLTIPMTNHKDDVIGVLQLINRKRDFTAHLKTAEDFENQVIPYTQRLIELMTALAGLAAVSIENSQLYEEIERLSDGGSFVPP